MGTYAWVDGSKGKEEAQCGAPKSAAWDLCAASPTSSADSMSNGRQSDEDPNLAKVASGRGDHTLQGPPTDPKAQNHYARTRRAANLICSRIHKKATWAVWETGMRPSLWTQLSRGCDGRIVSSRPAYVPVHGATPPENRAEIWSPYETHYINPNTLGWVLWDSTPLRFSIVFFFPHCDYFIHESSFNFTDWWNPKKI